MNFFKPLNFFRLSTFFNTLLRLFYPPHCAGCEKSIESHFLCDDCWNKAERLSEHRCYFCSHQLSAALDHKKSCPNCVGRKFYFTTAVSAFRYQGLVRKLIFRFKYGREQSLKKLLGEFLALALKDERLQEISFTAVVPVPLYFLREREREFNQARHLADEVARRLKLPVANVLKRTKSTSMQARASRRDRIKNLQGSFRMKRDYRCSGNYLLIDDVFTTGSTADECAKTLIKSGASGVWVVTAARS